MTTRRQARAWERAALLELRTGDLRAAVDEYTQHRRVFAGANSEEARSLAVEHWGNYFATMTGVEALNPDSRAVLIAYGSERVDDLTQRARVLLRSRGEIDGPDFIPDGYSNGFASGDRVLLLFTAEFLNITQGSTATVRRVNSNAGTLTVEVLVGSETVERTIPAGYLNQRLVRHAYALDVREVQAQRVGSAFYVAGPQATREEAYSAMSRGSDFNAIYIEPTERLALNARENPAVALFQRLSRSRATRMALDVLMDSLRPPNLDLACVNRIRNRQAAVRTRVRSLEDELADSTLGPSERETLEMHLAQARQLHANLQRRLTNITNISALEINHVVNGGIHTVHRSFSDFSDLDPLLATHYGALAERYAAALALLSNEEILADHVMIEVEHGITFEADFIVRGPAGVYVKEVKAGKGSLTKPQKRAHPLLASTGGKVVSGTFHRNSSIREGVTLPPTPVVREIWR